MQLSSGDVWFGINQMWSYIENYIPSKKFKTKPKNVVSKIQKGLSNACHDPALRNVKFQLAGISLVGDPPRPKTFTDLIKLLFLRHTPSIEWGCPTCVGILRSSNPPIDGSWVNPIKYRSVINQIQLNVENTKRLKIVLFGRTKLADNTLSVENDFKENVGRHGCLGLDMEKKSRSCLLMNKEGVLVFAFCFQKDITPYLADGFLADLDQTPAMSLPQSLTPRPEVAVPRDLEEILRVMEENARKELPSSTSLVDALKQEIRHLKEQASMSEIKETVCIDPVKMADGWINTYEEKTTNPKQLQISIGNTLPSPKASEELPDKKRPRQGFEASKNETIYATEITASISLPVTEDVYMSNTLLSESSSLFDTPDVNMFSPLNIQIRDNDQTLSEGPPSLSSAALQSPQKQPFEYLPQNSANLYSPQSSSSSSSQRAHYEDYKKDQTNSFNTNLESKMEMQNRGQQLDVVILKTFLQYPSFRERFSSYLDQTGRQYLRFIEECESFKELANSCTDSLNRKAYEIHKRFLSDQAMLKVPVKDQKKFSSSQSAPNLQGTLFHEAQQEVIELMVTYFVDFKNTWEFEVNRHEWKVKFTQPTGVPANSMAVRPQHRQTNLQMLPYRLFQGEQIRSDEREPQSFERRSISEWESQSPQLTPPFRPVRSVKVDEETMERNVEKPINTTKDSPNVNRSDGYTSPSRRQLLEQKYEDEVQDKSNSLVWMAFKGEAASVRPLIQERADVNTSTVHDLSPLLIATLRNNYEVVRLLISSNALITKMDAFGRNALDYAMKNHNLEIVEILLFHEHSLSWTKNMGVLPIERAVEIGFEDTDVSKQLTSILLNHGASPTMKAMEMAQEQRRENPDLWNLFCEYQPPMGSRQDDIQDGWKCPRCTLVNQKNDDKCSVCDCPRMDANPPVSIEDLLKKLQISPKIVKNFKKKGVKDEEDLKSMSSAEIDKTVGFGKLIRRESKSKLKDYIEQFR